MSKRRPIELSDLPPRLRRQAEAQLRQNPFKPTDGKQWSNWEESQRGQSLQKCRREPRGMNNWETAYATLLETKKMTGAIMDWKFEPVRLRIGAGAYYKPDFLVVQLGIGPCEEVFSVVEFHEVKGFWREAARVRIKVAADLFPWWKFIAVTRKNGVWMEERF